MKCIEATKPTKNVKIGEIKRVQDRDADLAVKDGYWKYVSKSIWKESTRKKSENIDNVEGSKQHNEANKKSKK